MISFAALPMLFWLAAAAIPLLLLRNRIKHFAVQDWSSNRLLQQALQQQQRHIAISQWLLLVLRTSAILLLAVAVADPIWIYSANINSPKHGGSHATLVCYVIDNSPSMELSRDISARRTFLNTAKDLIRFDLEKLQANDLVAIMSANEAVTLEGVARSNQPLEIKNVLDSIETVDVPLNSERILSNLVDLLPQLQATYADIDRIEVSIYSDFTTNDWTPDQIESTTSHFNFDLVALAPTRNDTPVANLSVFELKCAEFDVHNRRANLKVQIGNSGETEMSAAEMQWWVDGRVAHIDSISLAAGQRISFSHQIELAGANDVKIEVRLPADHLACDNQRFAIVPSIDDRPILVVAESSQACLPLSIALESLQFHPDALTSLEYRKQTIDYSGLHFINPDRNLLIKTLKNEIENGKHIFIWIGDKIHSEDWLDLSSKRSDTEFLPSRKLVLKKFSEDSLANIFFHGNRENALEVFGGLNPPQKQLSLPLATYYKFEETSDDWQVGWQLSNADPFTLTRSFGRGRITWIVTPPLLPDTQDFWNAFVNWPSFIPFVDQLMTNPDRVNELTVDLGQFIDLPSKFSGVVLPNDRVQVIRSPDSNQTFKSSFGPLTQAGYYRFRNSETWPAESDLLIAANIDPREFTLQYRDILQHSNSRLRSESKEETVIAQESMHLFRWLLVICIILLLSEIFLSTSLIKRSRSKMKIV